MQQNKKAQKATKPTKNRGGRPPKAPENRKTVVIKLRFTPSQAESIKRQAVEKGFKFASSYLCRALSDRSAQAAITPGDSMTMSKFARNSEAILAHLEAGGDYPIELVEHARLTAQVAGDMNKKMNKLLAMKGAAQ